MGVDEFPLYDADEDLIAATTADLKPRLNVYCPNEAMVVLGRGSQAAREVDLDACARDGVPVRRRRGGGCSVVLDPGNVIVSVVLPCGGIADTKRHLDRLCLWLADGLRSVGFSAVNTAGISDLVVNQQKVVGSCVYRNRDILFFSATILVNPDVTLITRYLQHPPREPGYRAGRNHGEFLGSLRPSDEDGAGWVQRQLSEKLQLPPR